jgi:hypothetical protein
MDQKMKTESTFFIRITSIFLMAVSTFLASPNRLEAQCQMACTGTVNASMDPITCETIITPSSLMNPTLGCPLTGYTVSVKYLNTTIGPLDTIRLPKLWIGRTVEVSVLNGTGNSCWGLLKVEDKSAPIIDCRDTIPNLYCFQNPNRMRPDSLGFAVVDCSNYTWSTLGLPIISECNDVMIDGEVVTALRTVTQTWVATDINGMSSSCDVTYNILPIEQDDIVGPANDTLPCFPDFAETGAGFPHPSVTGYPYAVLGGDTVRLIPGNATLAGACNITTDFRDRLIKTNKIIRTWDVSGWVCGDYFDTSFTQLILIVDDNLPELAVTPPLREVTTSGHACSAIVRLSNLFTVTASDKCSPVTMGTLLNGLPVSNTALITVPVGDNEVTYIATDESGNSTLVSVTLRVVDKTPPTAICMKSTVAITNSGMARLPAAYFNNGSKDECGAVTFSVRRMDRKINCDTITSNAFGPHVDFCCTDVGTNVMVELRVTDVAGNSNTCMVEIEVQNKLRPTLVCPTNQEVACNTPVTLDSAGLATRFGTVSVSSGCGVPNVRHSFENSRNQCGVGTITRKWIVYNGNSKIDSCTQTIFFDQLEGTFFYVNPKDPNDTEDDIVWPAAEVEIEGCLSPGNPKLSTDSIGKPIILYDRFGCGVIAMTSEDHVFTINTPTPGSNNACLKILRTWKVIDWCQPRSQYSPYTFQQVIKVINRQAPTISSSVARDSCAELASCNDSIAPILTALATDDCSGSLSWTYSIDLGNNGSFDIVRNGSGSSINATQKLPLGTHRIIYTFRDLCGNVTSREHVFRLSNCKPPTPYLYEALAIGIMRMNGSGMITTWASDFDKGSSHPCGGPLYFAFSPTRFDTARTFTCADLGPNEITIYVGYAFAPGDTVWNSVDVILNVQDNNTPKACPTSQLVTRTVRGQLATEFNEHLKDAQVYLDGFDMTKLMTDDFGSFEFNNAVKGFDYILKPYKNDDIDNGVNTLDLIRIQRHILGISKLDSPFKIIAADVNRDGRLTVTDLIELRKVVLGVYSTLPNNTSWRFIDKNYVFKSIDNALSEDFNEQYDILDLSDNMKIDFVSVKVGDIDANATTKANSSQLSSRTAKQLYLNFEDQLIEKGQIVTVPLGFESDMELLGMQLGLKINSNLAELIKSDVQLPQLDNSGLIFSDGTLKMSWNIENAQKISDVIHLTFIAKTNTRLSEILSIGDFSSQAYSTGLEGIDLELRSKIKGEIEFELFQNTPNPFAEVTEVKFILPQASSAKLTVFDVKGRALVQVTDTYEQGTNSIYINRRDLGATGVYYYTIEAGSHIATKKMVIID